MTWLLVVFAALTGLVWAQAKEAKESKMLFDFEDAGEAASWEAATAETSVVAEHATSGKNALKVVLKAGEYPGINTAKVPNDWSGYKELQFDVFADQDFTLFCRIDDENSKDYASRYNNDGIEITKGKNSVTLGLGDVGAAIDLKKVKLLILFGSGVQQDTTFYLDNVRLVK
jgi:hypothetical protein